MSVLSSGTESTLVVFGRGNLFEKARSQPEKVRQVLEKIGTDGIVPTFAAVQDKLGDTITPGYCEAGTVLACGDPAAPFVPGDRVVTNGPHAEVVRVPYHLAARIPDGVSFESAAFTPLAAIALQGLRLAQPSLGESVVVYGLGLVGQLAVQIARAHGCRVLGIDLDPSRLALAETFGATAVEAGEGLVEKVRAWSGGHGADIVLLTLATDSDEPVHLAAEMSRKRGRIVLVGVTGLELRRSDFYEKELSFQVSCSYGPGRYDPEYEEKGHDYPIGFVRWTEQRNFEAVLELMADGRLDPVPLISHRFPIDEAPAAYDLLLSDEPSLGILLTYPEAPEPQLSGPVRLRAPRGDGAPSSLRAGVIGAGNFARRTLLPAARDAGFEIRTLVSSGGVSAAVVGKRVDAELAASEPGAVLEDPEVDTVFVLTRHDAHADLAARALVAGKHVFVEKPLALTEEELEAVREAYEGSDRLLLVGFNRRFAPHARALRGHLATRSGPLSLVLTVNAGSVPSDHWTQDPERGGGRIVGEACHFLDLARFLVGAPIADLSVLSASGPNGRPVDDISHITLGFEDGSTAVVHYLATGSRAFPKERVEAFWDGRTARIDNWRRLRTWGVRGARSWFPGRPDKGHGSELAAFADAVRSGGPPPIPFDELYEVSLWSIRAARAARGEE